MRRSPSGGRIGVYGGTFNPVHLAHLIVAEEMRERMRLDRVLFIPSGTPPHKNGRMPSGEERLEMVRLATAGNPSFSVLDTEVRRDGPSYTIETLRHLHRRYRGRKRFFFLIGMDAFEEIETWKEAGSLPGYASFVVFPRPGHPLERLADVLPPDWKTAGAGPVRRGVQRHRLERGGALYTVEMESLPISASLIRRRAARGRSLRYLVPRDVERYLKRRNLYGTPI